MFVEHLAGMFFLWQLWIKHDILAEASADGCEVGYTIGKDFGKRLLVLVPGVRTSNTPNTIATMKHLLCIDF